MALECIREQTKRVHYLIANWNGNSAIFTIGNFRFDYSSAIQYVARGSGNFDAAKI